MLCRALPVTVCAPITRSIFINSATKPNNNADDLDPIVDLSILGTPTPTLSTDIDYWETSGEMSVNSNAYYHFGYSAGYVQQEVQLKNGGEYLFISQLERSRSYASPIFTLDIVFHGNSSNVLLTKTVDMYCSTGMYSLSEGQATAYYAKIPESTTSFLLKYNFENGCNRFYVWNIMAFMCTSSGLTTKLQEQWVHTAEMVDDV